MTRSAEFLLIAVLLARPLALPAQTTPGGVGRPAATMPPVLQNVGFEPELNRQVPLDVPFQDESGRSVQLRDYFHRKPVVLAFVYYRCPMLCNQVQQGVVGALRMLSFNPGHDYEVVFISFDPRDTPEMAAEKKQAALSRFGRRETESGWHFLTGARESIDRVTEAANFRYSFSAKTKDRKSTRLNSSHVAISYAVFCLK